MATDTDFIRNSKGSVRPYVYGDHDLPQFLVHVFEATILGQHTYTDIDIQYEVLIGDAVIFIEALNPQGDTPPWRTHLHVYVADVDASYQRAIEAGAALQYPPTDRPNDERQACVSDWLGNTWYIATHTPPYKRNQLSLL